MDNKYWIDGKVSIPKEKRAEFNENVLRLFRLCGIRKLKEIKIAGKTVTVVHEPEPDDEGIVRFDYSVFEQCRRQVSTYDMNTCELHSIDRGYAEFGVVMNFVMVMQEAYSTEQCYFMYEKQICKVYGYALTIEQIAGLKLSFPNREKVWDMFLFFKSGEEHEEIKYGDIWDIVPHGYCEIDLEQLMAYWFSSAASAKKPENCFRGEKSEIKEANTLQRTYYAYELFLGLAESRGKDEVRSFLKMLLEKDIAERERLAQSEDEFGVIAEISLYEFSACIVAAYGWAIEEEFWSVWYSLGITEYRDIYRKEESAEEESVEKESAEGEASEKVSYGEEKQARERIFYKMILRENEDEFLEFFDDQKLCLSDDMRRNLREWKQAYEGIDDMEAAAIPVQEYLADILLEMQDIWGCRYMDEMLVTEFMEHSDDIRYKKALLLFRRIIDVDLAYFPELTARQVKKWIVRRCRSERDRIRVSGYISLLANRKRRVRLLGF